MDVDYSNRLKSSIADKLFVNRWSPRAFESFSISDDILKKIIDAARWSPSCSNEQPWIFYTTKNKDKNFNTFVEFLSEGNQKWAKTASVIGFITSRKFFEKKDKLNSLSEFDCGAAWMSLALQASLEGLHTHGMGGINRNKVSDFLQINSDKEKVLMGFVIGKLADSTTLGADLRSREIPSDRKQITNIWKQL